MLHYCPNLVDTSVITSDSRIILPWTIIQFNDSYSIMEFFHEGVKFRLEDDDCVLHAALLDMKSICLIMWICHYPLLLLSSFGKYLQYKVDRPNSIISAARHNEEISLSFIESVTERNKRDALYNNIVSFFTSSSLIY